jgi:septal ring factor EnvC (AmiA/AmiB activator)
MEMPEGFLHDFDEAALVAANSQVNTNIASIEMVKRQEEGRVAALQQALALERKAKEVRIDACKQMQDEIAAKLKGIQEFADGIAKLRGQQEQNNRYIEYIRWLRSNSTAQTSG